MGDRLVRWGLPRAANAVPLLMEFVVVAVATVLAIRFALFITGYPQLGGSGLHIAHVLWGGLLMAVGVMALLSFNGRVIRPIGSFLAGVGFGLFIDEVGKFLTSDNDYFFTPSIAIIYVLIVLLVLGIHALHGRRPLGKRELYVAALNMAAAGAANGMTDNSRALALRRIDAAADLPGAAHAAALVQQIPSGRAERYDVSQIGSRVASRIARALRTRPAMITTIVLLLLQTVVTLGFALLIVSALIAREVGANAELRFTDPVPTAVGGASAILSAACVVYGVVRLRQKRRVTGYRWLQRAVLIDLLLTRVFEFAVYQFAAIPALVIDLLLLAALEFAIRDAIAKEGAVDEGSAEAAEAGTWSPARTAATAGVAAGLGATPVAGARPSAPRSGLPAGAIAAATLNGADGVRNATDIGPLPAGSPGAYPGAVRLGSGIPAAEPIVTGQPSAVAEPAPGGQPLPAEPPALGGPAAAPAVLPGATPVGGPAPYFATLSAADPSRASGTDSGDDLPRSGDAGSALGAGGDRLAGSGDAGPAAGPRDTGADVSGAAPASTGGGSAPGLGDRMRLAFTGGCHSHAGVIGGAMSAGCGAVAGGLVAGVSTRSAALHGSGTPDASADAGEIVGEALDDSAAGDHASVPTLGGTDGAAAAHGAGRSASTTGGPEPSGSGGEDRIPEVSGQADDSRSTGGPGSNGPGALARGDARGSKPADADGSTGGGAARRPTGGASGSTGGQAPGDDDAGRSPRSVGGQPPAATWVGSRSRNAGAQRYRSADRGGRGSKDNARGRTPESNVESKRRMTPPPLS